MKSVATRKLFSFLLAMCMVLNTIFAVPFVAFAAEETVSADQNEEKKEETLSHAYQPFASIKEYQYSEDVDQVDETSLMLKVSANAPAMSPIPEEFAKRGVVAVRVMVDVTTPEAMAELGVSEPYRWLMVGFENEKATEVALSFADIPYVLDAEYNYTRQSSELPSMEENPLMNNQWHLQDPSLQNAWKYLDDNDLRQKLSQVVVAVIDTGVDYTHPNLVNSMWVNVNEIPGDDIDNDNNGYCDDVYGISTLGNSMFEKNNGDPMDEMGHGTHVAGIVAASEGSMGAVGVAYGAKIMAIKAGDSSGIFSDSDVIEGINYAILMGADVINMSFGSYARSAAIEDALALAYTSSVLVAAAGNDGLDIVKHNMPSYPAAYNFVIGVMATDVNGGIAAFSNTDYILRRNSLEYEICAPGTSIFSTLPGNQYRAWSGTSMACPYISAVAAILRAKYDDKSVYSTRYIMGQLVGTAVGSDGAFPMVDPYAALTDIPEPDISYYDYYIFDDPEYSDKNNGDGIIDAGETIGLGVLIRNHWGQARNTKVKLIAAANATDATICPYVTWITDTVDYGDIGTFNTANNGFSYDADGVITGISNPFMFTVSDSIPNDYHIPFSLVVECESYTELDDTRTYRFDTDVFNIQVRKGYELPRLIDTDMTLTADRYYIISGSTLIESGVTVTVEPGTQIQFWGDYSKELYAGTDVAELLVDGELIIRGTAANPVDIFPSGSMSDMKVDIKTRLSTGKITMEYCNIANPTVSATTIDHCYFTQMIFDSMCELNKDMDGHWYHMSVVPRVKANEISNSIFYELGYRYDYWDYRLVVEGKLEGNLFDSCGLNFDTWNIASFRDNVFLKNYRLVESQSNDRTYLTSEFRIQSSYNGTNTMVPLYPVKNPETGATYFVLHTQSIVLAEKFAKQLGGSVAYMDNEAEKDFLLEYAKRYYAYNEELNDYNWNPCLNYLYVGFYSDGENVTYVGEGNAENWLKIPQRGYIPMISTSYYKSQDSEATREAWMTNFYSGDTYWMESYLSQNPSTDLQHDRGVIIEIPGEITPISVSLECDALTIPSNTVDYRVIASVYPETDHYTLSWSSDNESVVKVGEDGKLTAVGVGTATVTVKVNGMDLTDSMIVVVTQYYAPESISDTTSEIFLNEYQQTKKLSPVIAPAEATALIAYSSSDTNVAVVGFDGTVSAISSGTAVITAQVVGTDLSCEYTVKVAIPPQSIALVKDYIILPQNSNEKQALSYYFEPAYATEGSVEYLSSDESVVLVSETGELTPVAPGNAIVWISFPDIDRALQAKVIVVEDGSSVNITSGGSLANWNGASVLYAEDGTTYLLMDENVFGNSKLAQEFPYKTKGVACAYSDYWFYIDMENHLRCINTSSNDEGTIIAEGVSHVWATRWGGYRAYYQKLDGTVWFYSNGTSTQNVWLENIVDGVSYNNKYIFLDDQGRLWYDNTPDDNNEPLTPLSFDTQLCVTEKKIAFLNKNGCFDEEGTYYNFSFSGDELSLSPADEFSIARLTQELKVTWDQVVDATRVSEGATSHWLLLLNDGRVIYAGYYYPGEINMLADLISIPSYSGLGYCFLDLDQNIASLGTNALIGTDGSVLTYIADYGAVLGNGKNYSSNQSLKRPVYPWFGTKDDGQNVKFDSASFTDEQGNTVSATLTDQALLQGRVDPNSAFTLTLSKPIVRSTLTSFVLKDGFNNKVELDVSIDRFGKTLTITPREALREGYDYTLSIPTGVIADEFGNTNRTFSFGFTVSGVAVYEVPVTGIVAEGKTEISLEYGQVERFDVCVLPENASMQKVYWSSSNEKVATVNASGYVTGHQNGTATITATAADGGFTVSFTVTVCTQPDEVSLYTGYFLLEVGEKGQMDISSYPDYADLGNLTYGSNRNDIVTVDENGVLTAVGLGSALVYVTSSVTGESYYALVDVVEDSSFAEITDVHRSGNDTDHAYFIAEDNSVWYVTTFQYENENTYIPRKANFKATKIFYNSNWGQVFYISLDGNLYRTDNSMDSSRKELIAEDVVDVAVYEAHVFCIKSDGSVCYYNTNTNKDTECSILNGTAQLTYFNEYGIFCFLNQDGKLRYISRDVLDSGVSNSLFKTVSIPGGETIDSVSRNFAFGEDGGVYRLDWDSAQGVCTARAIEMGSEYQAIKARIVKMTVADMNNNNTFIALLDDGSVYFVGNVRNIPIGLSESVDCSDVTANNDVMVARPINGVANVADLDTGYFLLTDGTVLAYQFSRYGNDVSKMMLANNNMEDIIYRRPVISWFGANDDGQNVVFDSVSFTDGQGNTVSEALTEQAALKGRVDPNSAFTLMLSKSIVRSTLTSFILKDEFNSKIELDISIDRFGNILTITPREALREGYDYTLSIPAGVISDEFGNTNRTFSFGFTVSGVAVYEVPVTGIVAESKTEISLEYGQVERFDVCVLPENASMQKVYWSSSNEKVATVNASGYVTGHQNGTATITATAADGGFTVSFNVTVCTQPDTVSLYTGYFLLEVGEKGQMDISSYPDYADLGNLTYGSNRNDIVTVDENGVLTAVGLGSTLVYVTSSVTGESYYALVDVVEDSSFAEITDVHRSGNDTDRAYFIAEDNSVWYVTTSSYGNENPYIPRKANFKATKVFYNSNWGQVFYISLDGKLYRTENSMHSSWKELIAEDVVDAAASGAHVFCIKSDGSVYYYNTNTNKAIKCSILNGTAQLTYFDEYGIFCFLNQDGKLRYISRDVLESSVSNSLFKTVSIPGGETIDSVSRNFAFGEDGGVYRLDWNYAEGIYTARAIEMGVEYQTIKDRIVKMTVADMNNNNTFIALLDDGSVYFVGNVRNIPIGLSESVDCSDVTANNDVMVARPIHGVANVAELDIGYFLLTDGTVLAYQFSRYGNNVSKMMLGNNNMEGITYRKPVIAWFGVNGEQMDILFESAQAINGDASTSLSPDNLAEGLNINTSFVLTFNKQLYSLVDGISLIDMGGNLIPVTVAISDSSLIITPKTALKEGTLYTLSIPCGAVLDIFQNTTQDIEINFTTIGELHFEIPVEEITDTIKQVSLTYGETEQLYPTIMPANASMKRVSWTTSDPNVVTVTQDGVVTGRQNGTATVTVTSFDGDFTYEYTVTVFTAVDSFTLSEEFVILDLSGKKTVQLVGSVTPSYLETDGLFTWSVADPDIATVDSDGTITALKPGVTAVYCYCEGFSQPMICIVSVFSDYDDVYINRVSQKYNGGFLFEAGGCLWLVDSAHTIPEKLVFQKPIEASVESDEEEQPGSEQTSEILQVSDMKQVLYVPGYRYSDNAEYFLVLFLEEDGTLSFYFSDRTDAPCLTRSGVKKIAYANSYLILLMDDGSLTKISVYGRYLDIETETEQISLNETPINDIAGIKDIVYREDSGTLFLLQSNKGLVWSYNPESSENALSLIFSDEPITDITLGNGSFMRGESGKIYPLDNDFKYRVNELKNLGFYNLQIEIEDIVNVRYSDRFLLLTKDGKLAYFGYEKDSFPLAEQYSGYTWKQDDSNSYLHYIEPGKVVTDIGRNWILFADGTVKMFGEHTYLGNAKYTEGEYADSLCSPYFAETEIDIHSLTLQKVTVGDAEIDISAESTPTVETTKQIMLEFSLPLVYTDFLMATTVQDSQNNCPAFDIKVEGRKLILIFDEALTAGETYTVTVYANAAQDIFHNLGERISFKVSINNTAATAQGYEESLYPTTEYSPDWTLKQLQSAAREYYDEVLHDYILDHSDNVGNAFLNAFANPDTTAWMNLVASENINSIASLTGNFWGTVKTDLIDRIIYDVNDSFNYGEILYDPILSTASETAYPFVTSILVKNSEGNVVSSVGMEDITVEVYFNRDMDTGVQPTVTYGSDYPFGDFAVTGDWQDARTWVGTTKISAVTGSGTQFFKVRGAVAAGDSWLVTGNDYERFAFTIATSGAKSMSMQANGADGYVALEWTQDDYETMAGYNVYRSEQPDGTYTKLNRTLISQDIAAYVDDNVDPGVLYYYYFTVVGTDLKESEPSGIAMASAHDTTPPTVMHTAVVQAPVGAAISIVANVYDNLNIDSVKLYYRIKGQSDYSCVDMYCNANASGRYTATIPAGIVTADGVEYYIEASDGRQNGSMYNATNPQSVKTYQTYSITVLNVSGGRITVSKTRAKAGDYITATAIAESGYAYLAETLKYTVDGNTYVNINDGFTMPEGDVILTATFVEESGFAYGDLNRDGIVNSADAILLMRYDAGLESLDAEQMLLADVNRDGRITVYDANEILRIDVGL